MPSNQELDQYRKNGYLIARNLLNESLCSDLQTKALVLRPSKDDFSPIPMPHRRDPAFLAAMRHPSVVEYVEHLFDAEASGIGGEYFFHKPGTQGFTAHQDNSYFGAEAGNCISVWIALEPVDKSNGGLFIYPGSHLLGDLPVEEVNERAGPDQNPGARRLETLVPAEIKNEDVKLSAGDALVFHAHLAHGSHMNSTKDRFRNVLLNTYVKKGEYFRAGHYQKRTAIELHI